MSDQNPQPPGWNWGNPPPPPESPDPGQGQAPPPAAPGGWGTPRPQQQGLGGWDGPPQQPYEPQQPPPQPQQPQASGWGAPQQSPGAGWGAPHSPGQDPNWAPPPPPSPRRQPQQQQPGWGSSPQAEGAYGGWAGAPQQQPPWQASPYGAPGYGAFAPTQAPTPSRGRLAVILGGIAAAVVVVLVVGIILVPRLLTGGGLLGGGGGGGIGHVPPATGNTVSTSFVQLRTTSSWSEAQTQKTEVELTNSGDGDLLVGYGNSSQDEVSSDESAFSNLEGNLKQRTGGSVSQCVPEQSLTVGGKAGEEEGFRFSLQGTDLCLIAWVDYVSSSRYYFWNVFDDYSKLSTLEHDNAAMQETVSWKV